MKREVPLVSIIVPTFNRAYLLGETLRSVVSQSFSGWELVVVDDGSEEDTEFVTQQFNDTRIKYIKRQGNISGANICRNIGIKESKGDFIMFLDSDDLLLQSCIKNRVEFFKENPDYDFLAFPTAFFKNDISDAKVLWNRFDEQDDLFRFLNGDVVWHTSGSFFKRESLLKKDVWFNEAALSGQDWFFHLDALLAGMAYKKIETVPDVFIRRNAFQPRISNDHGNHEKVVNRLQITKDYFKNLVISGDTIYENALAKKAYRDAFLLQGNYSGLKKLLKEINSFVPDSEKKNLIKDIWVYNQLKKHPFFYKIYYRLYFSKIISPKIGAKTKYRSPMTEEEVEQLKEQLAISI